MGDRASQRPRRTTAWTTFLVLAGVLSLAVSAGSGFAIATIRHVETSIQRIPNDPEKQCTSEDCLPISQTCVNEACNFLVLGSDSRKGVPRSIGTTKNSPGQRSDTILVVQVDARHHRTIVLSIPRDLRVTIPGHGINKINTAFNYGPNTIVRTVQNLTHLSINHYVQVNFLGFEGLVNALGGVPICVDRRLVDTLAGLNIPHRGCYTLTGRQALAFVRARHIEGDNIPDFSRISRQQQFMRALISKVLSAGSIFHIPDLIKAVQHNLTLDKNLNLYSLQDLTRKLGEVGQRGVTFRVVPSIPVQIGGVDYVELQQPQADLLFERIRDGKRLGNVGLTSVLTSISPANVTVRVMDASSGGAAQQVVGFLDKAGFNVLPLETAPSELTHSEILWQTASLQQKEEVAAYLTLFPARRDTKHTSGLTITVVVGSDFPGIEGM
jgi:LCP family protein required for cell wall assembly